MKYIKLYEDIFTDYYAKVIKWQKERTQIQKDYNIKNDALNQEVREESFKFINDFIPELHKEFSKYYESEYFEKSPVYKDNRENITIYWLNKDDYGFYFYLNKDSIYFNINIDFKYVLVYRIDDKLIGKDLYSNLISDDINDFKCNIQNFIKKIEKNNKDRKWRKLKKVAKQYNL